MKKNEPWFSLKDVFSLVKKKLLFFLLALLVALGITLTLQWVSPSWETGRIDQIQEKLDSRRELLREEYNITPREMVVSLLQDQDFFKQWILISFALVNLLLLVLLLSARPESPAHEE